MDKELLELNERAKEEGKTYKRKRFVYSLIASFLNEKPFLGLIGPRGVGKSIILKQLSYEVGEDAFYISMDDTNEMFSLYEIAKELEAREVKYLLLDEIQFYPHFDRDIKKIFDFIKIKIVFTGSAALTLTTSSYDLSRRVRVITIPPPSLREFITFKKDETLPVLNFSELINEQQTKDYYRKNGIGELYFNDYLKGRNYLFTFGIEDHLSLFNNILEKIVSNDLLKTGAVAFDELRDIRDMLKFIGKSFAEDINYSSLAKNCGITKYKAEKYVSLLEKSFVLNVVSPKGTNILKEPKIMFSLPYRLLYKDFDSCIGSLREDFFVGAMRFSQKDFAYLKSTRGEKTPDYLIDDIVIEVGGRSKGRSQFKGFSANKKIILTHPGKVDELRRPLFLLGMVEF